MISPLNNYFDKVYLLNLHKRKDRLSTSIKKLNQFNIDVEIFGATDGSVMDHIWSKLDNSNFTNSKYLACAISHLSIYADAIQNKHDRILIIEDDCKINTKINEIFTD